MNVCFQITDGCGVCTTSRSLMHRLCCGQAGMAGGPRTVWWPVKCRAYKASVVTETQGHAGHYKVNSTKVPQTHYTPALAQDSIAHHPYTDTVAHIGDTYALGCALTPSLSADCGLASLWICSHPSGSEVKHGRQAKQ